MEALHLLLIAVCISKNPNTAFFQPKVRQKPWSVIWLLFATHKDVLCPRKHRMGLSVLSIYLLTYLIFLKTSLFKVISIPYVGLKLMTPR